MAPMSLPPLQARPLNTKSMQFWTKNMQCHRLTITKMRVLALPPQLNVSVGMSMDRYLLYLQGFGCDGQGSSLYEGLCRHLLALLQNWGHQQILFFSLWRMVLILKAEKKKRCESVSRGKLTPVTASEKLKVFKNKKKNGWQITTEVTTINALTDKNKSVPLMLCQVYRHDTMLEIT